MARTPFTPSKPASAPSATPTRLRPPSRNPNSAAAPRNDAMSPNLLNITPELTASVATKTQAVKALLADIAANWSTAAFANSLGAEDMVLTDLIVKAKLPIEIFSLDPGRLPLETYDLM